MSKDENESGRLEAPVGKEPDKASALSRRTVLSGGIGAVVAGASWYAAGRFWRSPSERVFIARAKDYSTGLATTIVAGLRELGCSEQEVRGKRILLKPNLVEPQTASAHINTHPEVVRATAEAFLRLGAARVAVAEGAGHRRDALLVLELSGLAEVLSEDRIPFIDLNSGPTVEILNAGGASSLRSLSVPAVLSETDLFVSIAKMKTHHWAGATLSMKNLFGIMPGQIYGWPKNVLHWAGLIECILDINRVIRPNFSIVDGIVGMEGDGPILGTPVRSGALVLGRNSVSVDATCCRVMGIDPLRVEYLQRAASVLGPVDEDSIAQCGEKIDTVRTRFRLLKDIPAHARLL